MAVIEVEVTKMQQASFNYTEIDEGIRDEVKEAARSIHQLGKGMQSSMVAIGKRLIEVKGMLPHGQFTDWIASEFDMSERMARNFMNVTREYDGKTEIISVLSDTVLYMLAAPSTPPEARAEVEQVAIEGKRVTVEFADATIRKHKPEPVRYAPIYALEDKVREWLRYEEREAAGDPDTLLDVLKAQNDTPLGEVLALRDRLMTWLREQDVKYRRDSLIQAVNNVRDQRRQAARQASARTVYVEPVIEPKVERVDGLVELMISPTVDITSSLPNSLHWATKNATPAQLEAALAALPAELVRGRAPVLQAALKKLRHTEPVVEPGSIATAPDPRIDEAQRLIDALTTARDLASVDYGRLIGRDTDLLQFNRSIEELLEPLRSLVTILTGKE